MRIQSKWAVLAALCVSSVSISRANGPQIVIVSPKPGDKIEVPRDYDVVLGPVKGVVAFSCELYTDDPDHGSRNGCGVNNPAHPTCRIGDFGVVTLTGTFAKPRPVTIGCSAHGTDGAWGPAVKVPVQLVTRPVVGYAGKKFDGDYWRNTSGGGGGTSMGFTAMSVKSGVVTIPVITIWHTEVKNGDQSYSFGPVQAKFEEDGRIVPQTMPVTVRAPKAGTKTYPGQDAEAKGLKHVTILGQWSDRGSEGKTIDIKVYSDFIRGDDPQGMNELPHVDNRMVIRGASGGSVGWCSRDADCHQTHNCCPSR